MLKATDFGFNYFLGGFAIVENLIDGALKHGGATMLNDRIISNIEADDFIHVMENNSISVYVPSTTAVDNVVDNAVYVEKVVQAIKEEYKLDSLDSLEFYNTKGSWYSDDMQKVVIEDITVVTFYSPVLEKSDVEFFISIAELLKREMSQEGVSLSFNNALAIV